jgi:ribonucleoside-diphosphate reductase alpha chain
MHKGLGWGERRRLPDTRKGAIHKFTVGGQEGYLFLGKHDDGSLGELFVEISKEGSALSGLLNMACIGVSVGLQYGVPLQTFIDKFKGMKFEPHGFTGDPEIPMVSSLADYIARYLEQHISDPAEVPEEKAELPSKPVEKGSFHGPPCHSCGNLTARAGSCFVCLTCGTTTGCG